MPRLTPRQQRTRTQRLAAHAGWIGAAILMASLLYWLYRASLGQPRTWPISTGLGVGAALVLFFLAGMGAAILAGLRSPEGRRSARSAVLIAAVLGILVVANVLAYRRHWQWDVTGNRRLTLAPLTVRLLNNLKQKITVTAFYTQSPQRQSEARESRQVRDLLEQYADRSPRFTYHVVDYLREPDRFVSARVATPPPVILFANESGGREEVKGATEKDFTAALLKLTRSVKRKVVFTVGHGELNPSSFDQSGISVARQVLTEQQHDVSTVDLMGRDRKVPAGCSVLVIAGPQVDFRPEEIKAVKTYLDGGGRALVLLRPGGPSLSGLLKDWGLRVGDNVVAQIVDFGGVTGITERVRISDFESHEIDRGLSAVLLPIARTVESIEPPPAGITVTPLLRTNADTVARPVTRGQERIDLRPKPGDAHGPFTVAALAEKQGDKAGKVVAIGSAEFAMDVLAADPTTSNLDLFTNAVNWLADEHELVDIPPRDDRPDQVTLTPEQRVRAFYVNLLLFPVACLFMATYVWWKRR
ncbi:MAG: Gldg family protein [Chthonomonadales bacterium]|nr:Gldg family protein [Chthonomonadales bacterium]